MVPVVSIVGRKNSGKTTLIEGVVAELKNRGYRIGTIKHHHYELKAEDIDREGKDTYRHQLCGAETVVLSSSNKLMLIKEVKKHLSLDDIAKAYLCSLDLILAEGYKTEDKPKIEVFRQEVGGEEGLLCIKEKDNLCAIVSDKKFDLGIPCFELDDYLSISDFLEKEFISKRQDSDIELVVNQKEIYLKGFVPNFLKKAILGMISSLHDVPEKPQEVEIRIKEKGN